MKYQVFEMAEPCSVIAKRSKLDESWHQDTFSTFHEAEYYAGAWGCGRMQGFLPAIWHSLKMRPFPMVVNEAQYIRGSMLIIKEVTNA